MSRDPDSVALEAAYIVELGRLMLDLSHGIGAVSDALASNVVDLALAAIATPDERAKSAIADSVASSRTAVEKLAGLVTTLATVRELVDGRLAVLHDEAGLERPPGSPPAGDA